MTQWFTIGADPRVMVGVNQFASSVDSFDPTIGSNSDYISTARFSAVGAIDTYVKIPIHDQVKLFAAYNLFGTGNISRPQQQIDYNVNDLGRRLHQRHPPQPVAHRLYGAGLLGRPRIQLLDR